MELSDYAAFAGTLAELARPIARKYFRTAVSVDLKADDSPVSLADREIEAVIRAEIRARFPEHGILGEEEGGHALDAPFVWVIDPIDGTRAFLAGKPTFTTLVALCRDGVPVAGAIDQAITQERWIGYEGGKTTLNGVPVAVRPCESLSGAIFATTSPFYCPPHERPACDAVREACGSSVFGTDAYGYALIAGGGVDIVVESGLKPYDFCALVPVVTGAGGRLTDWTGAPLRLDSDGHALACGDARVHAQALRLLAA